jgi:hypothetical protein
LRGLALQWPAQVLDSIFDAAGEFLGVKFLSVDKLNRFNPPQ